MKNETTTITKKTNAPVYIELFAIALKDLKNSITNVAKIYGEAVEKHREARDQFDKFFPNRKEFFNKLEALHSGIIREEMFFIGGEVGEKLRRLPLAAQNEVVEKGVKMLTADGDNLIVRADTMTAFQARQIINPNGTIRSLEQQKAWVESQKSRSKISKCVCESKDPKVSVVKIMKPYEIKNGTLYTYGEQKFSRQQLFDILREMM